jgi:hypothetical protein
MWAAVIAAVVLLIAAALVCEFRDRDRSPGRHLASDARPARFRGVGVSLRRHRRSTAPDNSIETDGHVIFMRCVADRDAPSGPATRRRALSWNSPDG